MFPIAAVMVHVSDPQAGLDWYQHAFPNSRRLKIPWQASDYECLELDGVLLEVVNADTKVASGAAGSVVYWRVDDFDATVKHLSALGATLYRGPLDIEGGARMGQMKDPWGNCIGLRDGGKY